MASVRNTCKKIVAIGRNYIDHVNELSNKVPKEPVIFLKPSSSIIIEGESIQLPPNATEIHHEVELGIVIGKTLKNADADVIKNGIKGYVLALDMTDRVKQTELKNSGLPWSLSKGFDTSCPISDLIDPSKVPDPQAVEIWCRVNGEERQRAVTKDMLFSCTSLISFASRYFTLEPGDIILTGTPAGVGPVRSGDRIQAGMEGLVTMEFEVSK